MKASTPEKGSTYAKVDTWKVDMWKNAKRGYMNEKDMGMTYAEVDTRGDYLKSIPCVTV